MLPKSDEPIIPDMRLNSNLLNPIWTTALKAVCATQNPDNGSSTEVAKSHSERDKKPF